MGHETGSFRRSPRVVRDELPKATWTLMLPVLVLFCQLSACTRSPQRTAAAPLTPEQLAQLWVEPEDLAARDLLNGPGGQAGAPDPAAVYKVTKVDTTGHSPG